MQASMLDVKLMVPTVVTPALLYFNSTVLSHALASLLAGLAVIAVVRAPSLLATLAARILAFVLPEIEMTYTLRPFAIEGFWIRSVG
jgi:hypothetical protein